ncbi:MAG: Gfo/Idh/MocA family oxidoreductase [Actinomycetia bacterium]|nr:Gfo/Idh/MocA family oxidoreductase [Actinomycetes bacterium]
MSGHLTWAVGELAPGERAVLEATRRLLSDAGWLTSLDSAPQASPAAVLVWTHSALPAAAADLVASARGHGAPVFLLGPTLGAELPELTEASGVAADLWSRPHRARVRAAGTDAWTGRVAPTGEPIELRTPVLAVEKVREGVQVWATTQMGMTAHPVATWNPETRIGALSLRPESDERDDVEAVARLLHLALRRSLEIDPEEVAPLVIGLLGFGAIGAEHARAAQALPGMKLGALCDRSAERLGEASQMFPGVTATDDPAALLADSSLDVIVVSTPPDSHADWADRAMAAGKDVIVEKPFALTVEDSDRVLAVAERVGRRAVVYQNRRFDPDFLTIAKMVRGGALGEVFHLEAFVGGYGHPCNYWHSDESVSGGALYDWGSHLIDQILSLHPGPLAHVTCIEHKRVWHDVTNADHTTVALRFQDGTEAVFIHSDLAAALKPRWYLLGTEGAITSTWRQERVVRRSAVGTLDEDVLAVTDSPPDLTFVDTFGSQTALKQVTPEPHAFHREYVDAVRYEWPMSVTAVQSRRVVAVMEAARASARAGGTPMPVNGDA